GGRCAAKRRYSCGERRGSGDHAHSFSAAGAAHPRDSGVRPPPRWAPPYGLLGTCASPFGIRPVFTASRVSWFTSARDAGAASCEGLTPASTAPPFGWRALTAASPRGISPAWAAARVSSFTSPRVVDEGAFFAVSPPWAAAFASLFTCARAAGAEAAAAVAASTSVWVGVAPGGVDAVFCASVGPATRTRADNER